MAEQTSGTSGFRAWDLRRHPAQAACGVGAVFAVTLVAAGLGDDGGTLGWVWATAAWVLHLFSTVADAIGHAAAAALHGIDAALRALPWTIIFYASGVVCAYQCCRYVKTCSASATLSWSVVALAAEWILRTLTLPGEGDGIKLFRNACIVLALIVGTLCIGRVRAHLFKIGTPGTDATASLAIVFLFTALLAAGSISYWTYLTEDADPEVSALVMRHYGAELEKMGFEDLASGVRDGNGLCVPIVSFEFRDGVSAAPPPAVDWPISYGDRVPCLGMRLREGHLTIAAPTEPIGVSVDAAREREMKAVEVTIAAIRVQRQALTSSRVAAQR